VLNIAARSVPAAFHVYMFPLPLIINKYTVTKAGARNSRTVICHDKGICTCDAVKIKEQRPLFAGKVESLVTGEIESI